MTKLKAVMVIGVLSLLSAPRAFANEGHAQGGACREEAQKFCGDVKPGGGAMHDCMKAHEGELSAGCKERMAKGKKEFEEKKKKLVAACGADIKQYCANVTPGEGREIACLKSYEDKLSTGCKDAMKKGRDHWKKNHGDMKDKDGYKVKKPIETPVATPTAPPTEAPVETK